MRLQPPPSKDKTVYQAFAAEFPFCFGCGRSDAQSRRDFGGGLEIHHFIRQHRAAERCVLAMTCWRDHKLAHGAIIRVNGLVLPTLSIGVYMTLKEARDYDGTDWDRCRQLRGSNLPDFERIPGFLEREFRRHRPRDKDLWAGPIFWEDRGLCGQMHHHDDCRCQGKGGDR